MFDRHIHSKFSFDSSAEPKDIVAAAEAMNLDEIVITDHVDYGFVPLIDFDEYFTVWNSIRKNSKVKIKIGVEVGYNPEYNREAAKLLKSFPFEFVVNSIHAVNGVDLYYSEFYDGKTREEAYREYLNAVLLSIDVPYEYNSVGHIGYVERCSPFNPVAIDANEFTEMRKIAEALVRRGVVPEINTSGATLNQPRKDFLKLYKSVGGKAVVTSSDAHTPNMIGKNIELASNLAQSLGLKVL